MRRVGEVIYTILYCPTNLYETDKEVWIDLLQTPLNRKFSEYEEWAERLNRQDQAHHYRAAKIWLLEVL